MSDRAKSAMGGEKPKKKESKSSSEKPYEMHIKRAHGGGFVVTHHKKKKPMQMDDEPETHVVPDADQLGAHVQDAMGDQPPAGTPMPDQSASQTAPAQGAQMPQ